MPEVECVRTLGHKSAVLNIPLIQNIAGNR
jgi:hypothetical protein